jgi:hypothetical protein
MVLLKLGVSLPVSAGDGYIMFTTPVCLARARDIDQAILALRHHGPGLFELPEIQVGKDTRLSPRGSCATLIQELDRPVIGLVHEPTRAAGGATAGQGRRVPSR